MSVDLVRKEDGERLSMTNQMWAFILTAAEVSGWKPSGTSLINEETEEERIDWDASDYSSNEGQSVDEDDAEAMADALKSFKFKKTDVSKEEGLALEKFIDFVEAEEDGEIYYPGFEIW